MTIGSFQADPQVNGTPTNGAAAKSTSDALIDSALDFLSTEEPANDNAGKPKKEPPAKPQRPDKREPDDDEGEEVVPEHEPGDEGTEDEGEDGAAEEPEEHPRGSEENPFTVKDLPKDKLIELKVDGEKIKIPLSELADGYIRERTFSARINRTKALADEAERLTQRATQDRLRLKEEFQSFIHDPEQIYDFFLASEEREKVFVAAAERYAMLLRKFREDPDARLRFQRQRDQVRLQKEREHWEAEKEAERQEKARKEAHDSAVRIFKPGWEEGLRRAGFPKATRELYDEVMVRVNQRAAQGHTITSDDVATFTERAAKLLELPKGNEKPKPAPVSQKPTTKSVAGKKNGVRQWDSVPAHQRRRDPEYFLRNLRTKDFR